MSKILTVHCDPTRALGRVGLQAGALTAAADVFEVTLNGHGGHGAGQRGQRLEDQHLRDGFGDDLHDHLPQHGPEAHGPGLAGSERLDCR